MKQTTSTDSKWALVTGASSGIGRAFVNVLASQGYNIVLLARNLDRLDLAAKETEKEFGVNTVIISCDLSEDGVARSIASELAEQQIVVSALVNNAGYGDIHSFMQSTWDANNKQLNAMLCSVAELCYLLGQKMKEQRTGWIINVASLAAFTPNLPGVMYNGIKSFVVNMTEALDLELKPYNVNCLALCPGMTETNFPKAMGAEELFAKIPRWRWMTSEQVALEGFNAVNAGKSIHIPGKVNRLLVSIYGVMPFKLKNYMGKKGLIL